MLPPSTFASAASAYRGRFAPTPSAPLHLGSLIAALASYREARRHRGLWLLRIDDLDSPRCPPGTDSLICAQLEAHGLYWDGLPRRQSQHLHEYGEALESLIDSGHIYACACTRAVLAQTSAQGPDGPVYSGTCRESGLDRHGNALRFRIGTGTVALADGWQGEVVRSQDKDIGDFVVRRADGIFGYQLACAVDEFQQGITEVVRGADLLASSLRQILLLGALAWPQPDYRHLPVLADAEGRKLSKQNHAPPIEQRNAARNLSHALEFLGQTPPPDLAAAPVPEVMDWAQAHWTPESVPGIREISAARLV